MAANNSSCFNYRVIAGTDDLSEHAYGKAVDINPLYNPYVLANGSYTPLNAGNYVDRRKNIPGKIDHDDLCYQLFRKKGYYWGGDWEGTKDYQHFQLEKRYKRI
ncbi:MAG: M15 family metallopeptidase [Lachnospiraceae bacterium]|nr:M15 family metallopeptidase [Lachnospiraceae bacterium]